MRQRLGVARCLLADPELLILDEPMNGLDPAGILEFRRLIRELVGEGRTVLLSSHLLDEVEKTCDLAAIVDQGRVVAQGSIHELVRGGPRAIDIVCHSPVEAARCWPRCPGVTRASDHEGGLRVTLSPEAPVDREIVTALLRRLLDHGVGRGAGGPGRLLAGGPLPDHDHPSGGSILMLDLRLIAADVLKLRRRRGMLSICAAADAGRRWLLAFIVMAIQHARQPGRVRAGRRARGLQRQPLSSWRDGLRRGRHRRRHGRDPGPRLRRLP